ncbi:glutamyl-tRNA reductase [Nocardioides sp.]|uniref:glutamyl-tRNA reductase n=1 Tax=Nocardioides sp. TaxID=35761 RepID=UPI0026108285|nr:glutamyl-tRNA reductase [Nocardioides sp.]
MSVLVVGISHKTAPVSLLEKVSLDPEGVVKLISDVVGTDHVTEATVIATCNRLEIYTEVDRFHGSVEGLSQLLVERADEAVEALLPHLYVHYDDGAVTHLFRVAAGLDSMAVGEGQILGQAREALRLGQELGTVGAALNTLFQQALRVGKRTRAETEIDRAAPTLVSAALAQAVPEDPTGKRVVIVGAGAMAGLATATVSRLGCTDLVITNRTLAKAERLATEYGGTAAPLDELAAQIAQADVVIACAGARGYLVAAAMLADRERPVALIDLAMPRDIDPAVAALPGVTLVGLEELAEALHDTEAGQEVEAVRDIVSQEVQAFLTARRQASVTPTVVALRSMATQVVDAEIERLDHRLPDLDDRTRAEVLQAVRRVADKLLHEPTVRVRELANEGAITYERALAELFALNSDTVAAVTSSVVTSVVGPRVDAVAETGPAGGSEAL